MEYIRLSDHSQQHIYNIREDHPNVIIPDGADLSDIGYAPLSFVSQPTFNPATQKCYRDGCEKVGDAWQYKWHIDDLSAEQIAENQAAAQAAVLATYDKALTDHLDAEARTHRYDNRINCALRAGYAGPYHAEGVAFAQWMDSCNAAGYAILEDFQAGRIPQPTVAEVIATLPVMVWPA